MYRIYQTEGWVVHSMDVGEANRFLEIFTADLGLVRALAQGVRKLNSKLRYGLQDYSFSKISLVRGREFWRVVNSEKLDNFNWILENHDALAMTLRIFSLLRRLIKGEAQDRAVFQDVRGAFERVVTPLRQSAKDELRNLEIILVFRILQKLGYVGRDPRFDFLADFTDWETASLEIDNKVRAVLLSQINNSLLHSHL